MLLKDTLTEIKFYYRHFAALGCLITLFVYIYYADASKNLMNKVHEDGNNPKTRIDGALDDDRYNFGINKANMSLAFGVAVILALSAMSVQHDTTKLFKSSPMMKKFNNWLRLFIAMGVIVALILFIYYSERTIHWARKAHHGASYNLYTDANTINHEIQSFQSDELNTEISLQVAIILSLIVLAIKEY